MTAPADQTTVTAPADQAPSAPERFEAPKVRLQRKQKITGALDAKHEIAESRGGATPRKHIRRERTRRAAGRTHALRNTAGVRRQRPAPPPALAAERLRALTAELAFPGASARSLAFYRIPLFLLPIYRAAAARYGVPWRILAAINEVETDYGNDESVSTAGAVGWMQFMPETWMRYGVDAFSAGDADPYNPVDAIFAAARYLRDMGAAKDLRAAIFAYNHSAAYVESVMLRAELISTYPKPVIATLTGLADGRLPVTSGHVAWGVFHPRVSSSPSTAAANAKAVAPAVAGASVTVTATAPATAAAAAAATGLDAGRLADVRAARNAAVVAVQTGRIVGLGRSRKLGWNVVLRDLHGDVFTYSGLGSIAQSYIVAKTSHGSIGARDLRLPLRRSSLVKQGTVLARVRVPVGARDGHLRFAIRPAGDRRDVDPRPILANWALLAAALHPLGASGRADPLDAATRQAARLRGNRVREGRLRATAAASRERSTAAGAARSARSGRGMPSPVVVRGELSAVRWDRLIARIGALQEPTVAVSRSYRAIGDRLNAAIEGDVLAEAHFSEGDVLEEARFSFGGFGR